MTSTRAFSLLASSSLYLALSFCAVSNAKVIQKKSKSANIKKNVTRQNKTSSSTLNALLPVRSVEQKFAVAIKYVEAQEFDKSLVIFSELTKIKPDNALYWFNRGQVEIKLSLFQEAKSSFDRVIELKSNFSNFSFYWLAHIAKTHGDTFRQQQILRYLAEKELTPYLRQLVESELASESTEVPDPDDASWFSTDFSFGYNTNPELASNSTEKTGRYFIRPSLVVGQPLQLTENQSLTALLQYQLVEFFNKSELRDQFIGTKLSWKWKNENSTFKIIPFYNRYFWGKSDSLQETGIKFSHLKELGVWSYGFDFNSHYQQALDPFYSFENGPSYGLQFWHAWYDEPRFFQSALFFQRWETQDLVLNSGIVPNRGYKNGASFSLLWKLRRDWVSKTALMIAIKNFSSAIPGKSEKRKDTNSEIAQNFQKRVSNELSVYINAVYGQNQSNMGSGDLVNKNYNYQIYSLGIIWDKDL